MVWRLALVALFGLSFPGGFAVAQEAAPPADAPQALEPATDAQTDLAAEPATAPAPLPLPEARAGGKSDYVRVLSPADYALYKDLFQAAGRGDLAAVEAGLAAASNKLLAGHLLARAYLAGASSPSFEVLQAWLIQYATYPEAARIHALARRKGTGPLTDPERRVVRGGADDGRDLTSDFTTAAGQAAARRIRPLLSDGRAGEAQAVLSKESPASLGVTDYNQLMAEIAAGLYYSGRDEAALQLASKAAQERDHAPLADWIAGLSSWRMKNYSQAAYHFEAMAMQPEMTSWLKSAAGFWAGRAYIAARQPHKARTMFELAAGKPRTFYGLISIRVLGDKPQFTWRDPKLDPKAFQRVVRVPTVARAVALAQLGQKALAEDVMLSAHGRLDGGLDAPFISLAADMGFASAQYFAASAARSAELRAGSFPMLPVQPRGGFQVDPALIHAIIRQESRFQPGAVSSAGARGLMQVLPSTAKLGEDPKGLLFDAVYNLTVGQAYVREMMRFATPDGNLFHTAIAYNAGPGNLQKWLASVEYQSDPLLFIESLPARETRGYVERVMANYWIYQMRLGKATTSLDDVAAGRWPLYAPSKRYAAR
jgi:soluble lytic murein transglycosylase-like protein